MGYTIAQKIIKNHLVCGEMTVGSDIGLKIDQTLTQDATGTMAYIEYEAMGIPRVKTEKSVAYIDTTHFRQVLRTPMTTDSFSLFVKNTVSIFQDPATAFVTRFTLKDSVNRERL